MKLDFTDNIIKVCRILNNIVYKRDSINYEDAEMHNVNDIEVRGTGTRSHRVEMRNYFDKYLMGPGVIDFQYSLI